ncbi:synaptonemal complex protein 2-like [Podarcis raffonei]|uniref:synaptonemal complex protein 2-like n=1 Tax=Podarcis raffonei TaxID=65483 RepID=UPI0023292B85|nr:synaptonemal complex protein 2-like [Podarcis raffonei]
MAICTQNVLRTSERHILALLNQIHQSRLNELEHFHKTVTQELANLEKRTRFLSNLEKDTLDTVHGFRAGGSSKESGGRSPKWKV